MMKALAIIDSCEWKFMGLNDLGLIWRGNASVKILAMNALKYTHKSFETLMLTNAPAPNADILLFPRSLQQIEL